MAIYFPIESTYNDTQGDVKILYDVWFIGMIAGFDRHVLDAQNISKICKTVKIIS